MSTANPNKLADQLNDRGLSLAAVICVDEDKKTRVYGIDKAGNIDKIAPVVDKLGLYAENENGTISKLVTIQNGA